MPDRYTIFEEIGRGGMGVVYRTRDPKLGREVALKALREGLLRDADAKRRFEREAKALARLDHRAIVHVYDAGVDSSVPFLVMSYVEGESLRDHLGNEGKLTPGETARLGRRLASALSHAHEEGILHRDLKPRNALLEEGRLARAVLALPEKYRKRLRTTKRGPTAHPGGTPPGESHPHLPKQSLGLASHRSPAGRKARGVVNRAALLDDG